MSDDPNNLRQLPSIEPPAQLWDVIEARLEVRANASVSAQPESKPDGANRWVSLTMAAAVSVLVIGLAVVLNQTTNIEVESDVPLASKNTPHGLVPVAEAAPHSGLLLARRASALLERQLRFNSNQALSAEQIPGLLMLENELGLVDELLIERPDDTRLWQQRIKILDQMNQGYSNSHWQAQVAQVSL